MLAHYFQGVQPPAQPSSIDLVLVVGGGVVLAVAAVAIAYLRWRSPRR